jgi:hypothetical protein
MNPTMCSCPGKNSPVCCYTGIHQQNVTVDRAQILLPIREVEDSNLGQENGNPNQEFSWISPIPPGKCRHSTVTYWPISKQRLGKNSPTEPTCATTGRLLLGNGSVNTSKTIRDNIRGCFPWGPPRENITRSSKGEVSCQKLREFSWRRVNLSKLVSRIWSSSEGGSRRSFEKKRQERT